MSGHCELVDERERVTDGGQEHVAARLVRLGLEREAQVVAAVANVRAADVDRFGVPVERRADGLGRIRLAALATTPHDVHRCAELDTELDGIDRLRHRVAPNGGIVGRERAVLEDRAARRGSSSP